MFNLFGKPASLDDLIARKKYAQAVVVMREQFRRTSPDAPSRQQFAELLILADRRAEAVPILLGLADEDLRFGFLEKAKEALQRIEQVESGRPDVAQRLRRITGLEQAPTESRVAGKPRRAAKDGKPEPKASAEATMGGPHQTVDEPAASEGWDTDLSQPIAMVLELPPLDREEPLAPEDDAIEVTPEPLVASDVSDCGDGNPISVELMDLFPMGEAAPRPHPSWSPGSRPTAPARKSGSPGR
jgi:hypothetical protein